MLYGTAESEPQADIVVAQLAQELYNSNLLLLLVQNLSRIDFEVRFSTLLYFSVTDNIFQIYFRKRFDFTHLHIMFLFDLQNFRVKKMLLRYSIIY